MERVLPEVARTGIEKMIEYAYSFEPYFAPTVVLGEFDKLDCKGCQLTWNKLHHELEQEVLLINCKRASASVIDHCMNSTFIFYIHIS